MCSVLNWNLHLKKRNPFGNKVPHVLRERSREACPWTPSLRLCKKQTNCKAPAEYHANVTLWKCNTAGLDERVRDAVLIIWSTSAHLLLELSALKWGDVVHYTSLLILPSLPLISILIHTLRWASCGLSTSALCTKGSKLEQPSAYWTRSYC